MLFRWSHQAIGRDQTSPHPGGLGSEESGQEDSISDESTPAGSQRQGSTVVGGHEWLLKRNCSLSPAQLALWFGSLASLSLLIALAFAMMGAWLVVPFAVLEISALGLAFVMFGRHAADYERIVAQPGKLTIETSLGSRVDRIEQRADWFRVEYSGRPRDLVQVVTARQALSVGRFAPASARPRLANELRRVFTGVPASR
ncbi:MAG: DUF2244 domain-containing protein [Burkholderiaceae bacterium]